jgi:serine/threonine protein kinase
MRLMKHEKRLEAERSILKNMDSPFICKYYGINEDEESFYMMMEMVQGGELKRLIHPKGKEGSTDR